MAHLFTPQRRRFLEGLSQLSHTNPFEPQRLRLEQELLGRDYEPEDLSAWSRTAATEIAERPNVVKIGAQAEHLVGQLSKENLETISRADDATLVDDLLTYVLYYRHFAAMKIDAAGDRSAEQADDKKRFTRFAKDRGCILASLPQEMRATLPSDEHLFACLFQVRRAFTHIFTYLIGESAPAAALRAQVWQSIFTYDMRRYRRLLYRQMPNMTTLITGPSGTGKELVAQAIGLSQYRAFDASNGQFARTDDNAPVFAALNLSALSPSLIESELFGHRKGAFTGAATDRPGWFEPCPKYGALFLDEIGELDPTIQVKLLRLVQSRTFSRLGESSPRYFRGKLITATNRDLAEEMRAGRFREDFYYRLCSDRVVVPSLRDQLNDRASVMRGLLTFLVRRELAIAVEEEPAELKTLVEELERWIATELPADYVWPGNIRELEQCVRNLLIRKAYHPATAEPKGEKQSWLHEAAAGDLSADELLNHYCRLVHEKQGGYEPAARVLGLDRRTVKSRVQNSDDA